jgi:UDP-2,3-diacylglucosamine pyrophosphatase LpxH
MACRANILGTEMPLEKELAVYEKMKADLLKTYEGKFVVIHGDEFCGAFDTAENAYGEGVKRFGQEPFLMKKVAAKEEVYRNQALSLGLMHARI